jgi:hypothetical protein
LTDRSDGCSNAVADAQRNWRFVVFRSGDAMKRTLRSVALVALALSLAACAPPPPPVAQISPPPKKPLDAKTQLETGKTY